MNGASRYLADTSFWISLLEVGDDHHQRALGWQCRIVADRNPVITTGPVLWELLNFYCTPPARNRVIQLYRGIHSRPEIQVIDFAKDFCNDATALHESRLDKEWGVVDCFSFEVMRANEMLYALTADHHFEQAGFIPLLLHDPATFTTS